MDTVSALVKRALAPYNQMPDSVTIACLADDLLRHGEELLARVAGHEEAEAALRDWRRLTADGPTDSPMGNWNHARALARTIRSFLRVLGEQ
ncbi:DUF6415 family natural product biosynthesis protein [Streptomyces erythrochromogenes]|uniref:DUF6415 family natural product biosynthesis protein n=1 Tax=Streptomyces erythrochromogenes TaxID=285574 RepID=A0ABZ1QEK8_9ACTN|nr:DUF6415 family natural product biosynthesis protein [Streptomyces erythrochromogenes]